MSTTLAVEQQALLASLWAVDAETAVESIARCAVPAGPATQNDSPARLMRGLLAYRSHGRELAVRALRAAYPVLAQLLDDDNFAPLARAFWQAHPPLRGDMAFWGDALPAFVQALPELADEPYLADVARVEWALHVAATAADASPDVGSFTLLTTHAPEGLTLCLSPGVACINSPWPVASILNAHRIGEPSLQQAGQCLHALAGEAALVWRQGFKPQLREASPPEAAFIHALLMTWPLSRALTAAPGLDLSGWLAPAVQSGLLTGARLL